MSNVLSEPVSLHSGRIEEIMYYVYILRSIDNSLYIGQTNNLGKRVNEHIGHLEKTAKFTKEHDDFKLVYKEEFLTRLDSMRREKQLKGWTRAKKRGTGQFCALVRLWRRRTGKLTVYFLPNIFLTSRSKSDSKR